ncbi:MAG: universal stress protein [Halobacteria archaeon]
MYRKILLPTDGSPGSRNAERHALSLAKTYDAELHVLYVINDETYRVGSKMSDEAKERGEEVLDMISEDASDSGIVTVTEIRAGKPHQTILDYIEKEDADMVVMGTNARRGLKKLFLGSVTEKVIQQSKIPVVTVNINKQRVGDAETAIEIAIKHLEKEGYTGVEIEDTVHKEFVREDDKSVEDSWKVKAESDSGNVVVDIDIKTGEVQIREN